MILVFQGGSEQVKLDINREDKSLKFASSLTNYQWKVMEYKMLFDKGKETLQEKLTDKMSDELFKQVLILNFAKQGYTLKGDFENDRLRESGK